MTQKRRLHALLAVAAVTAVLALAGCGKRPADVNQLLASAAAERAKGDIGAAMVHLKNAVQAAPEHAEARYQLGIAYVERGDQASAEKELRRALELRYDPAKAMAPLGRTLISLGEPGKALDALKVEAVKDEGAQAEILALRGVAQVALKRVKEGRADLEKALALKPDLVDALLGLARIAVIERKFDEAERLLDRAVAGAPANAEALLMRGDLARALQHGDPTADYRKAVEVAPGNVQARLNLALMQVGAGAFDDAERLLKEAHKLAPRNPLVTYTEALLEFRRKNPLKARELVLQVLKVAPNHLPTLLLAGTVEYALGSHVQAQTYLGRVVERAPENLYARKVLVASLAKTGQTQRARELLKPGLAQAPEDTALLNIAGELSMQDNDYAAARDYFARASKADPKSATARTGLAVSRLAGGDADAGLTDLEAAVDLDASKYQADILLVTSHLQRSRFDQALKALQSLEKKQPKNPLTYNLKAAALLGKRDVAAARRELERALELQPNYVPAALNLAQLDLQDKNQQAARQRLESIVEKDKDNVQALLALAEMGPRLGASPDEQVKWLERAARASPGSVQPRLMLARYYARAGEYKKALDVAQQAVAGSADNLDALETLGAIQIAAGEKNQALATYTRLTNLQPKSPVALLRLATAQAANNERDTAAASLRKALEIKPDFREAQVLLAGLELGAGRHAEALAIARTLQKEIAKSPAGFAVEGDVLVAQKKFLQAAKAYETAYSLGKSGVLAMKLHAAYAAGGKQDEGDERLRQWLKIAPEDVAVRFYAADAALKTARYKAAVEQYEWLLQRQPDNIVVLNNLAWCYQQQKDPRAIETAERAYKLKPDNPAVADTLGWMLVENGDSARGLEVLRKAVAAAPKAPSIRYHLARALMKSGDAAGGRNELERSLADDIKFPEQGEALKLLQSLREANRR